MVFIATDVPKLHLAQLDIQIFEDVPPRGEALFLNGTAAKSATQEGSREAQILLCLSEVRLNP
jgi:hypothetical protein